MFGSDVQLETTAHVHQQPYKSCISSGILPNAFDVFHCPCTTFLFILCILLPYAFLSLFHTVPLTSMHSFVNSVSFTVQLKHSLFEKVLKVLLVCAFLFSYFIFWLFFFPSPCLNRIYKTLRFKLSSLRLVGLLSGDVVDAEQASRPTVIYL